MTTPKTRREQEFEAFKKAWEEYPSQDNEGFVPDRGGFKCGWFAALRWADSTPAPSEQGEDRETIRKHFEWAIRKHFEWEIEYSAKNPAFSQRVPSSTINSDFGVKLLDDLIAQESELTKLRKRVEVLSELLGRTTSYIEHYASECRSIKDNDRSHMDLLIEIHKAKIAEGKE